MDDHTFDDRETLVENPLKMVWHGELEWQEKVTHKVQCTVLAFPSDVRFDNWPSKLIMQLIPKSLMETIGWQYFTNSKSVSFHPQECESLAALKNVLATGFAGCVHFIGDCDIKVLILIYRSDKKLYQGFIPNDQVSFVERIRTVILQEKKKEQEQGPRF